MPFRIALSGLHASSTDLKVTGNNIANSSTTGFKKSRTEFVDVYAQAYGAITAVTNGSGVRTSNIRQMFSQGNIEYTDNATDLAITGQGFFMVSDDKGRYLSRNGTFGLDRDGYVKNSSGQTLQIFPPIVTGAATSQVTNFNTGRLVDLQLQNAIGAPVATTQIETNVNLDADLVPIQIAAGPPPALFDTAGTAAFNYPGLDGQYHHATATTVYDSLGAPHVVEMFFRKVDTYNPGPPAVPSGTITNSWQMLTFVDGVKMEPATTGATGQPYTPLGVGASGIPAVLNFNNDGSIASTQYWDGATGQLSVNPTRIVYEQYNVTTGAAPLQLEMELGSTTQYGSDFAVNGISQNGFTTGRLTGFDVEDNGVVYARYNNGNAEVLGMVALGSVPNPQGLKQKGDSLWVESFDAGDLVLGQPGTASLGLIQSGALESSTVEIADELVNMIVAQRNYQANAQVITTADQMTQTLMNIR